MADTVIQRDYKGKIIKCNYSEQLCHHRWRKTGKTRTPRQQKQTSQSRSHWLTDRWFLGSARQIHHIEDGDKKTKKIKPDYHEGKRQMDECSHLFDFLVVLVAFLQFLLVGHCVLWCPLEDAEGKTAYAVLYGYSATLYTLRSQIKLFRQYGSFLTIINTYMWSEILGWTLTFESYLAFILKICNAEFYMKKRLVLGLTMGFGDWINISVFCNCSITGCFFGRFVLFNFANLTACLQRTSESNRLSFSELTAERQQGNSV